MKKPNVRYMLPDEDRLRQHIMDSGNKTLRASFIHLDLSTRKQYMHQLTIRYTLPMLNQIKKTIDNKNLGDYIKKNMVNFDEISQDDRADIMQEWLEIQ